MLNRLLPVVKQQSKRHYVRVMAFVVMCVVGASTGYALLVYQQMDSTATSSEVATATYVRSAPVRLSIPKINLDTTFVPPLGLNTDQTIAVPDSYEKVGWYSAGATPGEIGPSVILGHVDSSTGPAVFYSLGQLSIGDEIVVTRDDGSVAVFMVEDLKRYPQSEFPTLAVYGSTDYSALRLVTCTGLFDKGIQRYSHNLVVYARLKAGE